MRRRLVPERSDLITYEIREIVVVANKLKSYGLELIHENIGDPIAKGEKVEPWIKESAIKIINNDNSWRYSDSQGDYDTRSLIAERTNKEGGVQINADDVYFFNGVGDAIAKIFSFLNRRSRVIGPTPAYSTHSSWEAWHSGYDHVTYELLPEKDWEPNVEEIYYKAKYNDSIVGILLINPGNPTGAVIPKNMLKIICEIAEELNIFIICDEIYSEIVYSKDETTRLCNVIGNACGISLRGVSKEFPWPGSRCGWIEVYNKNKNKDFQMYIETILKAKRLEVCSTTLPQMIVSDIYKDSRYPAHLEMRKNKYSKRASEAFNIFSGATGITPVMPKGAFYMTILFDKNLLNSKQTLKISNEKIKKEVEILCNPPNDINHDKRFVYYLLGSTGIITVPLTGFYSEIQGIRITLLEEDDDKRIKTFKTIKEKMIDYIKSTG